MGLDTALKYTIRIGIFLVGISALRIIGWAINEYLPWNILLVFFTILRNTVDLFNFMWDIDALWETFGYTLQIIIALYTFKASMVVVRFFNEK